MTTQNQSVPDIQALHQNVLDWLNQMDTMFDRASVQLPGDEYQTYRKDIRTAAKRVENLELVTSIVAPMKAGKSTILNAIVGQELLPNRAAAMTTLPTEIVFDRTITEPKLCLSSQFIEIFQDATNRLFQKLQLIGFEKVVRDINEYPHLQELLNTVRQNPQLTISTEIIGSELIRETLTSLNDLVRLCSKISSEIDPLAQLSDFPRIQAPFCLPTTSDYIGKLVLVDTPGPNEAGNTANLYQIVRSQLRRSLAVLIVLDFTSLKTKADEDIKQEVKAIQADIGTDNLYVLVNKIDQRKEGDPMTSNRIQALIESEFGIQTSGDIRRFFEVSARYAFCAVNFIQEYNSHPSGTPLSALDRKITRALAQEIFGIDWEEDLEEVTPKLLRKKADKLWNKSGFEPFLTGAINFSIAKAAPKLMRSALNLTLNRLQELYNLLVVKLSGHHNDVKQIQDSLYDLKGDRELAKASSEILGNTKQDFKDLQQDLRYIKTSEYLSQEANNYLKKCNIRINTPCLSSPKEAEEERQKAIRCLQRYQGKIFNEINIYFDSILNKHLKTRIYPRLNSIYPYLQNIKQKIELQLNVDLQWNPPPLDIPGIEPISVSSDVQAKISIGGWMYNVVTTPFRIWLEIPTVDEVYMLRFDTSQIEQFVAESTDRCLERLTKFVNETLPQSVEDYVENINRIFQEYIKSLEDAIASKSKSQEELEKIRQTLEFLVEETHRDIERCNDLRSQTEQFL